MRILLASFLLLTSCAHSVHQVYVSDFGGYSPLERGEMVRATAEQHTVMGVVSETNYVELATTRLVSQCPQGEIIGITTQFSTSLGFFSWTNKILMQGLCLKGGGQSAVTAFDQGEGRNAENGPVKASARPSQKARGKTLKR